MGNTIWCSDGEGSVQHSSKEYESFAGPPGGILEITPDEGRGCVGFVIGAGREDRAYDYGYDDAGENEEESDFVESWKGSVHE